MMIRKGVLFSIALGLALFLAGCLDYQAYDLEKQNDADLIDEIAAVERELDTETAPAGPTAAAVEEIPGLSAEVEEEVVLPELGEELPAVVAEQELEAIAVKENELVRLKVQVTDPDRDIVTYTYSKPLNKDGEWKTNYGDAGEYIVTITASDGIQATEKKVKLVVERVNVAPIIAGLRNLTVREGEVVSFEPEVSDPNKDEVTASISEPLASGRWETDHASAGEYQIRVVATDGELESEQFFTLLVEDVNVLPEISNLPESLTAEEGETVTIRPTITDLDDDPLTLTISDPVGDDGVWETGYTDHGTYFITVTVSDGKDKIVKRVNLEVVDVNQPPVIEDVLVERS